MPASKITVGPDLLPAQFKNIFGLPTVTRRPDSATCEYNSGITESMRDKGARSSRGVIPETIRHRWCCNVPKAVNECNENFHQQSGTNHAERPRWQAYINTGRELIAPNRAGEYISNHTRNVNGYFACWCDIARRRCGAIARILSAAAWG